MKKIVILLSIALVALSSCKSLKEEWDPVFTFGGNVPPAFVPYTEADLVALNKSRPVQFTDISDLKAMYKSGGIEIEDNVWIKGRVISSDVTGNIYRELYIQDGTGGIDLKLGKSSLYSEYQLGQWIYVHCQGLTLGAYNGMPQLGLEPDSTPTNEYETSYIDVQTIIDQHVFKGAYGSPVSPVTVSEADINAAISKGFTGELWGKLVTVPGLKYGKEVFALLYPNSNLPHKSGNPENRVFLSDKGTWGITTWAMSKAKFIEYLQSGNLDTAEVGSGNTRYGVITGRPMDYLSDGRILDSFGNDAMLTYKEIMIKYATANYVSHYFSLGKTTVQVRTSGFSKFCDTELDSRLLDGTGTCDITGILSIYNGAAQFSLVDDPSESVRVY